MSGPLPAIILHVPHSGLQIPPEVRAGIVLDDAALDVELVAMTDHHTEHLARAAKDAAGVDATVFANRLSRLVVDPERLTDGTERMERVGMGAVYLKTAAQATLRDPDPERDAALLAEYFEPYAAALTGLVDDTIEAWGSATIVDVHSYPRVTLPYELVVDPRAADARPGVCVGTHEVHTPEWLAAAAEAAFAGVDGGVARDTPFAGTYVPLNRYGSDPTCRSVMVEIRRDLYMDEATLVLHGGVDDVTDRLADLLRAIDAA